MHLGVTPWRLSSRVDARELARQGTLAEAWGFESFWLPESHFSGDAAIPDPLLLLSVVAAHTRRIRLATTSYLLPLRHPLQAAEQVAVLDRLSNGRVILGVGRGYQPAMFEAFSVPRREKRRIFERSLETVKRAWRGEPVTVGEGEPLTLAPLPVQKPHPPLWVAAFGPKALAQAGRLGLPYLASPMETKARLGENLRHHADASAAAGVAPALEVPIMRSLFVSQDATVVARVRERLESGSGAGRGGGGARADAWAILGTPPDVKDQVAAYAEQFGVTHLIVTRLRIGGVPTDVLERSARLAVQTLAD